MASNLSRAESCLPPMKMPYTADPDDAPGVESSKAQGKNLCKWKMPNEAQEPMPAKRHVAIIGFCCSAIASALR